MDRDTTRRAAAEFFGTFWLTFGGCGAAVLSAAFPQYGIGFAGVALAFGLTVLSMAYAVGHISGGHFNPAVTLGLWSAGRCADKHVVPYIVAQVGGAVVAAAVLYLIASGKPGWVPGGFASNGYGELSPGKYGLLSCFLIELLTTFFFLFIIIGTTSKGAATGFAGIPIGFALVLIHLITIPVTNTSVNPARSTGRRCLPGVSTSSSSGFLARPGPRRDGGRPSCEVALRACRHRRDRGRGGTRRLTRHLAPAVGAVTVLPSAAEAWERTPG